MNSTKYQVFISSTYSDLKEERESIIKAILEMYHIPIGMEMFSAEDEEQWEIIRRTIEVSDYYILVLGLRYGSKTSEGISFTQKEYEYALEKKIPVLAFVMNEMVSLPKDKRDDDLSEINKFRGLVLKNSKMAQFWETKDQLIKNISISLMKQIMQKPGIGWVRGDKVSSEEALSKELTNLSKENRELRDKVIELESKISPKIPKIELDIEPPTIDEKYNACEKLILPKKLNINDIDNHLMKYISKDDIDRYNNKIPSQLELDEYNIKRGIFYILKNYSIPLVIDVTNNGTSKANNLYIDIYFPEEILIYEKDEPLTEPNSPLPFSPISMAESEYKKEIEELQRKKSKDPFTINHYFSRLNEAPRSIKHIRPINQKWWTKLVEKKLTIKIDSLLHTRRMQFDDEYMIAPLKPGKHKIEIQVICEEYETVETQVLEINISSKPQSE